MPESYDPLEGPGEVRALLRMREWSNFPPGPPADWSIPVRTCFAWMLDAQIPASLCFGTDCRMFYNDAYIALLGVQHPAALGVPMWEVWPEAAPAFKQVMDEAYAGKANFVEHVELLLRRGAETESVWFTYSATPVRALDGSVVGVFNTIIETTREVLADRSKAAESDRLREMFQKAPGFVAVFRGPNHVFELANDAYYRLVGQRELIGLTVREGLPELDGQGFFELLNNVYSTGKPYIGHAQPAQLQRRHGELAEHVVVDFIFQPLFDGNARVAGIFVQGSEVTQQHRSRVRLAFQLAMADRLRSLTSPEEIVSTASQLLAEYLNAARVVFAEVDDAADTFFIRRDWTRPGLAHVSGQARSLDDFGPAVIAELKLGHTVSISDITLDPRTAAHIEAYGNLSVRASLAIPLIKAGRLRVILGLHQDRPFDWSEQAILLAEDMAERTWAAVERARAEQEKALIEIELRKANRQKDDFLAMLAHELRNPLAPIGTAAELLRVSKLDHVRVRQTSEIISRQVKHMTGLVDDLLDVSRVTRGLITLEKQTFEIERVLTDAMEQVTPLFAIRHHTLDYRPVPGNALVTGDFKRLVQVMTNLLNNAAKYTPDGGNIVLRVETTADHVRIKVTDNGIGISAQLLPQIFDLFTQASRTSDRSQGGLGLGLALVKNLIELQGGLVTVHSDGENRGSTFTVRLPRHIEHVPVVDLEVHPGAVSVAGSGAAPHVVCEAAPCLRLLVVDDNRDAADMLGLFMEAAGYDVFVEYEPLAAIERARVVMPHACFLDIGLPGMDGNELARTLRKIPDMQTSVLVAVTGYGQQFDRETSVNAGFNHYFVKPTDPMLLQAVVANISAAVR
ncbi:MAG: ATP-binding protein [Pseudomonadota bacterium]